MSFLIGTLFTLASIVGSVQKASRLSEVPEDYMCKIMKLESNYKSDAHNKGTDARGLFQITKPTESVLRKRYNVEGDIFDPFVNSTLASMLTKEHITYLKKKQISVTYQNLYVLHFFGITTGYRFLTTSDDTKVKDAFPNAYKYNKSMIGDKNVEELKQYIQDKLDSAKNCKEI